MRDDGIEKLRGGGQAEFVDLQQQLASEMQSFADVARAVHARIVDESLPADGRARLFKINAHHDEELFAHFTAERGELVRVFHRALRIMNGAGADHDEQTRVALGEDVLHHGAAFDDGAVGPLGHGQSFFDGARRREPLRTHDTQVLGLLHKGRRL